MSKSTLIKVVAGVILVCAVLAGAITGAGFFLRQRQGLPGEVTGDSKLPERPPSTMTVHITDPIGVANLKTGEILPIHGQVLSNYPVASLELWVNGDLIEVRQPPAGTEKNFFLALWNWRPAQAGTYKLSLRGIDRGGRSAYSNLATVGVTDYQEIDLPILPTPNPAQLIPAPEGTPGAPLVGPVIKPASGYAPESPGGVPASGSEEQPPSVPDPNLPPNPDPGDITPPPSDGDQGPVLGEPPKASFNVQVTVTRPDGCSADLEIEDLNHQVTGYFIERSGPQEPDYYPVSVLEAETAKSSHYLDNSDKFGGTYYYKIIAYNATEQQSLDLIEVLYGANCTYYNWNGVVFSDIKVIPKGSVENLHCFIWLDNIVWNRLPPAEGSSIPPMSAEELRLWTTNLNLLTNHTDPANAYSFTSGYDLTSFAPDLSKTGFENFQLSIRCVNQTSDTAITLGTAKGPIDLKRPDRLIILPAEQFDAYVYIGSEIMLGNQPSLQVGIASPYIVEASGDPEICPPSLRDHCSNYVQEHYVILRWKWKPKPCIYGGSDPDAKTVCVEQPTNFEIYRYTYSPPDTNVGSGFLGDTDSNGYIYAWVPYPQENTDPDENDTYAEKAAKQALGLKQYCVRAVSAEWGRYMESEDFQESCVRLTDFPIPTGIKTITLTPINTGIYVNGETTEANESAGTYPDKQSNLSPSKLYTGLYFGGNQSTFSGGPLYNFWNQYGFFSFDLTPVTGKQILSAKLKLGNPIKTTYILSETGDFFHVNACAHGLMVLNRQGSPGWHNVTPPDATVTHNYTDASMDVTDEVRVWADGSKTNYGFMFGIWPKITVENFQAWGCDVEYGPIQLIVEYYD